MIRQRAWHRLRRKEPLAVRCAGSESWPTVRWAKNHRNCSRARATNDEPARMRRAMVKSAARVLRRNIGASQAEAEDQELDVHRVQLGPHSKTINGRLRDIP